MGGKLDSRMMQMMEYNTANRREREAIQSSAAMPRVRARIHSLMPTITPATKLRITQTATMVRHCDWASSSGEALATQGIAASSVAISKSLGGAGGCGRGFGWRLWAENCGVSISVQGPLGHGRRVGLRRAG